VADNSKHLQLSLSLSKNMLLNVIYTAYMGDGPLVLVRPTDEVMKLWNLVVCFWTGLSLYPGDGKPAGDVCERRV